PLSPTRFPYTTLFRSNRQDALWPKPGIDACQSLEAPEQQAGGREKHKRKRDFRADEHPQIAGSRGLRRASQRRRQISAGRLQRRERSEDQTRDQRHDRTKDQYVRIDMHLVDSWQRTWRDQGCNQIDTETREE